MKKRRHAAGWLVLFLGVLWLTSCVTVQAPSSVTELPTEAAVPTATNTPTPAVADLQRLHLGWIWPQDETKVRAEFAVGVDGVIYINDLEGRLHAVKLPGQVQWTFDEPQEGIAPPILGADGQTLTFVTVGPDKLYVLGTDGKVRRTVDVPDEPYSYPIVAPDGAVYLDTGGGGYRFAPDGGEPTRFEWSQFSGSESAAFDPQGRLYVPDPFEGVWVHTPQGARAKTCPISDLAGSLAGWPAGGFVCSTQDGDLVASDPGCRELWRYAGGEAEPAAEWGAIAVAPDGTVYAARENGEIVALDASGRLRWKHEPDEAFGHAIYLLPGTGGSLFAVTHDGEIAAFDRLGERVWSYKLPAAGDPGPPQLTPDGGLALSQGGRLWYFTMDPALVAAEPTPAPPPADQRAAEEEIVSFMLDYAGCQVESIFIWGPLGEDGTSVDRDHPLRVWWCSNGRFTEREDMQAAIADAESQIDAAGMEVRTYPVSTFEFGIDLADDLQNATVYVGWVRGPLWGQGDLYTLKRSATGEWWIVDQEMLWIS